MNNFYIKALSRALKETKLYNKSIFNDFMQTVLTGNKITPTSYATVYMSLCITKNLMSFETYIMNKKKVSTFYFYFIKDTFICNSIKSIREICGNSVFIDRKDYENSIKNGEDVTYIRQCVRCYSGICTNYVINYVYNNL